MPSKTQGQNPRPRLDPKSVRVALARRGWVQADLANAVGKSLTAVNLAINHGTFPDVEAAIRKELNL